MHDHDEEPADPLETVLLVIAGAALFALGAAVILWWDTLPL